MFHIFIIDLKVSNNEQLMETHARARATMGWPILGKLGCALPTVCLKIDEKVCRMSGLKNPFPLTVYNANMNDAYVESRNDILNHLQIQHLAQRETGNQREVLEQT
jgi:hypothetical protein